MMASRVKSWMNCLLAFFLLTEVWICLSRSSAIPNHIDNEERATMELLAEDFFEQLGSQHRSESPIVLFVIKFSSRYQPDLLVRIADLVRQVQEEKMWNVTKLILCGEDSSILDPQLQKHLSLRNRSHVSGEDGISSCIPPTMEIEKVQLVLILEEEAILSSDFVKYFRDIAKLEISTPPGKKSLKMMNQRFLAKPSSLASLASFGLLCLLFTSIRKFGAKDYPYLEYIVCTLAFMTAFIFFQQYYEHNKTNSMLASVYKIQPDTKTVQENNKYIHGDFFEA